jgi:hypothetical protein
MRDIPYDPTLDPDLTDRMVEKDKLEKVEPLDPLRFRLYCSSRDIQRQGFPVPRLEIDYGGDSNIYH